MIPRYRTYATSANIPRVAQPSIWHSIIPKALRERNNSRSPADLKRRKEWNPATFYIVIFLLIGSNAIQMITLKNEYSSASRKADAKMRQLREILERVRKGEEVDVEKELGTGNPEQEREWFEGKQNVMGLVIRVSLELISL